MIKRFDTFLLKTYIGPFFATFLIGDLILLMQFFWKFVDELVGKGIEWYVLAKMMLFASTTFIPMALPIGILLSSLITFGNLGERYELVALKASGISLRRILAPLVVFVAIVCCGSMYFSCYVLPKTNLKFQSVFSDIRHQKLAFNLIEGVYYNGLDGYMIRVNKKDNDDKTLHGVMIYPHKDNSPNNSVTFAEWGTMEMDEENSILILTLYNGFNYDDSFSNRKKYNRPFKRLQFEKEVLRFDMSQFDLNRSDESLYSTNFKNLNQHDLLTKMSEVDSITDSKHSQYTELADSCFTRLKNKQKFLCNDTVSLKLTDNNTVGIADNLAVNELVDYSFLKKPILDNFDKDKQLAILSKANDMAKMEQTVTMVRYNTWEYNKNTLCKYQVESNSRFALAVACLVLFLVGAPLGAITRKGGLGLPLVLAVAIFIVYYIILTSGQKSALEGGMDPFLGIWLANIIVFPIGLFLTSKATSDSPIMDMDYWKKFVNKFFHLFKKS